MFATVATALMGIAYASGQSCQQSFQLEVERRSQFQTEDYIFDLPAALEQSGRQLAAFTAGVSPALFDTFIASVLVDFNPCDINVPHIHPRATEVALVLDGEITMGFAEENGGQVHEYILREGQVMVFPQGVLHYQLNDNCRPARMYAVLNHHDPGTLSVPIRLNDFQESALLAAYGVNQNELDDILASAPTGSPAPGSQECLRRCARRG